MIYVLALVLISAIAKAFMDAAAHGKFGKGSQFWDASISWRNKWKNGDKSQGERFPLSSTVLVFTTDGWHLMQFICFNSLFLALAIYDWKVAIAAKVIHSGAFELVYRMLGKSRA